MDSNLFDIVTTVGPADINIIKEQVEYTKKNIIGYRNIYLISFDSSLQVDGCITISENTFPFSIQTVAAYHGKNGRNGWYLQQLLKLYAGRVITGILDKYLVIDTDTFFLKPTEFIKDNKCLYSYGIEYHEPYFTHMTAVHPQLTKMDSFKSGICHHMIFEKKYVDALISMVEAHHESAFFDVFLKSVTEYMGSGASEYEMYFNYVFKYHPESVTIRPLQWRNVGKLTNTNINDFESVHYYLRPEYNNRPANTPTLVLVHVGDTFPEYINDCIKQVQTVSDIAIHLLISNKHIAKIKSSKVELYFLENIAKSREHMFFEQKTKLDSEFRGGFWRYATERFFYLYDHVAALDLHDVFHIENDNLIFSDFTKKLDVFQTKPMWCVMDAHNRCIPSFLYFEGKYILRTLVFSCLTECDKKLNDMEALANFRNRNIHDIGTLPIINNYIEYIDPMYYENADKFGCLFDAAAVGQYIGGVDPRNIPGNTCGFINETCVFKCDKARVYNVGKNPYLNDMPLVNLHIHSKDLSRWSSFTTN